MSVPPALDRVRLAKLLGLLGSDHDGEVLNAARKAMAALRAAGLSWDDVLAPPPSASPRSAPPWEEEEPDEWQPDPPPPRNANGIASLILASGLLLSAKELKFVQDMLVWRGRISERQEQWLMAIAARARV